MVNSTMTGHERMVNVFVTGGAGVIGSNFVKFALETLEVWNITNLDKLTYA